MIELRDYQEHCVSLVLEAYHRFKKTGDGRIQPIQLPTGAGKTIVFSAFIHSLQGARALIIAHRDELLTQAAAKYRLFAPSAIIGKVGNGTYEYDGEITVASIATIARDEHLARIQANNYDVVIVDECHHMAAESYQRVLAVTPQAFVLGCTATMMRLDKKAIADVKPLFVKPLLEMIGEAYLCNLRVHQIQTDESLDGLHTATSPDGEKDFRQGELENAVNTKARNALIVKKYQEYADGKRAVAFCVGTDHVHALTQAFQDAGISVASILGTTPTKERDRIYKAYAHGSILVLVTIMVLTEGWDEPRAEVAILARPTQSQGLYIQMVGRVLRLAPNKPYATLLDITDNCTTHRLQPQSMKKAIGVAVRDDEDILEAIEREAREARENETAERRALLRKLKERREKDREIHLFDLPSWIEREDGCYIMEVKGHRIAIVPSKSNPGYYGVFAKLAPTFEPQCWLRAQQLDSCVQFAEKKAYSLLEQNNTKLVDRNASWRKLPLDPESKQAGMLRRFHIPYGKGTAILTKGQASDAIDERKRQIEERKRKKAERAADRADKRQVTG